MRDKKQNYIDEAERVEVERKFSLAKRKCGLGLIVTRLKETTCHRLAMSILLLNIRKIDKSFCIFFNNLISFMVRFIDFQKMAFVQ
ncbi:MAG: hypothetical protein WC900_00895 [Oscillospiraceae bacterium]